MFLDYDIVMFAFEGWGAALALAGGVIAGAGSIVAGKMASDAQKDAADQNAQNVNETNRMNERLFHEGRGSKGFATLPEFSVDASGNPIEPILMKDTYGIYDYYNKSPKEQAAIYRDVLGKYQPMQAAAEQTANSIFDGGLERQALDINAPVLAARSAIASTKKQAGIESLQAILNETKAIQQKRGFTGDSLGDRMTEADQRRKINTQFATDSSVANLENAMDTTRLRGNVLAAKIANINLPYQMGQNSINFANLPENSAIDQQARRLQSFGPFRLQNQAFKYDPLPTVQPNASTGQIIAQGVAGLGGAVGNFGAAKYLADQQQKNSMELIRTYNAGNLGLSGGGMNTFQSDPNIGVAIGKG